MSEANDRTERKDRLFVALDENHPSQICTLGRLQVERNGVTLPAMARVIDEQMTAGNIPTGRFILRRDAHDYETQLDALRDICKNGPFQLQEIDVSSPEAMRATIVPEWAKPKQTEKEQLIALRREKDERSDLEVLNAKLIEDKQQLVGVVDAKDAEIARLKTQIAKAGK